MSDHAHKAGPSGCGHPWAFRRRGGSQVVVEKHGNDWRARELSAGLVVLASAPTFDDALAAVGLVK